MLLDQREDLDEVITHFKSFLQVSSGLRMRDRLHRQASSFLAYAYMKRAILSKQPEDADRAAGYLRPLRRKPAPGISRHAFTEQLVEALAFQVKSESGDVMIKIGEISLLCDELLTSNAPDRFTSRSIVRFADAVSYKFRVWDPDLPLDQVIGCLQLARMRKPKLRVVHGVLALCLYSRYSMNLVNDDYEAASSILGEIISSPGESQDEYLAVLQPLVASMAVIRSQTHTTPEYSEGAIYRARAHLVDHPFDTFFLRSLESIAKQRLHHFGSIEGIEASSGSSPLSQPDRLWYENDNSEVARNFRLLEGLFSGIPNDDITKMDEALEKGRAILASSPPRDMFSSDLFDSFACLLLEAFQRTNNLKIEYLNESISTFRQAFERPILVFDRFTILRHLAMALLTRWEYFPSHRTQDMDEGLELYSQCVNDRYQNLTERFKVTFYWTFYARRAQHPTVSTAYESAISLMQDALLFGPTLQLQHVTLAEIADVTHRMPQDYASYQVDQGQLEEAIETLEKGRALLWSEMRDFRTSIDRLLQVDPQLGQKFAEINRDLEELTKSIPPSHGLSIDDCPANGLRAVDPFGRFLLKQRELLKGRADLIFRIQALPGFSSFMGSPSFATLRSAASSGPVIVINHSSWRSDIIILLHDTPPSVIRAPDDFFVRARALNDKLLESRNTHGPDSDHYNQTLAHILTELYDLVGKPVIERLRQLNVPEQSRIWWCPTSVFCSLPLHAMGPIPSDDGDEDRYFSNIYIPSYTPTLSALLESDDRDPGSSISGLPSLLLAAHFDVPSADVSLSEVCEDVKVVEQLNTRFPVKSLISQDATPASVLDGLRDHQFVHFICHGTLEARKPFDAGFELHGNKRLTLLDIVRSRLPAAEFAFLSACHTAELTEGSSAEEGLHLAAAVQHCGFRSVVGTMWAMANQDGPELAKYFYKSMFPKKEKGKGKGEPDPYYKRSAGTLRDAVKKLRKKRGITLERWVNYVHYGA